MMMLWLDLCGWRVGKSQGATRGGGKTVELLFAMRTPQSKFMGTIDSTL